MNRKTAIGVALSGLISMLPLIFAQNAQDLTVVFAPLSVPFEKRAELQVLTADLRRKDNAPANYTLELTLHDGGGERKFAMKASATDRYTVTAAPIEPGAANRLRISATFENGQLTGETPDRQVRIAGRMTKLSDFSRMEHAGSNRLILANGEVAAQRGSIEGPALVPLEVGGARVSVNLAAARLVSIAPLPAPTGVDYTLTVRLGARVVHETKGRIALPGAPGPPPLPDRVATLPPIQPPAFSEAPARVKLPEPARNIIPAGGGRYLILTLPQMRQLAVFDVNAVKITHTLPLPFSEAQIVAGIDKLLVWLPDSSALQRWSLETMEREATVSSAGTIVTGMGMGYGSTGPLMLTTPSGPIFLDADTLKRIDIRGREGKSLQAGSGAPGQRATEPITVQASPDGTLFSTGGFNSRLLTLNGGIASEQNSRFSDGIPSNSGLIFAADGLHSTDAKAVLPPELRGIRTMPALGAAYFIAYRHRTVSGANRTSGAVLDLSVDVYSTEGLRLLFSIMNLNELETPEPPRRPNQLMPNRKNILPAEQRIFLIPSADSLVTLNDTGDELTIRKVGLATELDKNSGEYLFVESIPPSLGRRRQPYRYPIRVRSRNGSLKYTLEAGPSGMQVDAEGVLTWEVPETAEAETSVIVSVQDASERRIYHSFNIRLR